MGSFRKKKIFGTILVVLISLLGRPVLAFPASDGWAPPQQVPGLLDDTPSPYLLADTNGVVHAFTHQPIRNEVGVIYSQWTKTQGWTPPLDIILPPEKSQARMVGAFLDNDGFIHLAVFAGDELGASLYYTRSWADEAYYALAWSPAKMVGSEAIIPTAAFLTGDDLGNLYLLYSGKQDGIGIYFIRSSDQGVTWTEPSLVFSTGSDLLWPVAFHGDIDTQGNLHFVWSVVNNRGLGEVVFYARYDINAVSWSNPITLVTRVGGDFEADQPAIIAHEDEIIVVYQYGFPATRWMRRSFDGGFTWSDPVQPFSHVGTYGQVTFLVDSANNLHMFTGNRTVTNIHGMWHSVWLGNRWSELEPVISGPRVNSGPLPGRFDPSSPAAVISLGNVILLAWSTDPGAGRNGVWFSHTTLATPALAPVPLLPSEREMNIVPTPAPVETTVSEPVSETGLVFGGEVASVGTTNQPAIPLYAAIIPVILILSAVVFAARSRPRHR
jgi:hypothetical protein